MSSLTLKDYQEDRKERGIYDKRNKLNDLTGKEWLFSTKTIIPKVYNNKKLLSEKIRNYNHLPFELCKEFIQTFTKPGNVILDPFAGIGSTIIGCHFSNEENTNNKRKCIGIENNFTFITIFNDLCDSLGISNQSLVTDNPVKILKDMKPNSVDFIFCDIPGVYSYQNKKIHQDHMSYENSRNFRKSIQEVLTNWNSSVTSILFKAIQKLRNSKYAVFAIPRESFPYETDSETSSRSDFALSSILTNSLKQMGLVLKAEKIWFIPDEHTKKTHVRNIKGRFLIFRKENYFQEKINYNSIFFSKKVPTGNTYILHKSFPPSYNHKLRREHGGMKPPELTQILIEKYSTSFQDIILDPFAGVGGTLLGASLAGRKAIGIDINKRWKEIYNTVSNEHDLLKQRFMIGDSRQVLEREIEGDSIDLILTDVPYWAMDKLKKTRGRFSKAGEKSQGKLHSPLKKFNQSTILTIDEWLKLLEDIFSKCYKKLRAGKFLVVFIGNMYRTISEYREDKTVKVGRYLLLTSMLAKMLMSVGFQFENEIIWYSPDKALHVFGYPFSYIPSVVHQSILVFKK